MFGWEVGSIFVEGCDAFAEDTWDTFTIGKLAFHGVKLCARCKVLLFTLPCSMRFSFRLMSSANMQSFCVKCIRATEVDNPDSSTFLIRTPTFEWYALW